METNIISGRKENSIVRLGTAAEAKNSEDFLRAPPARLKGGLSSPLRVSMSPKGNLSPLVDPDSDVMLVIRNTFVEAVSPKLAPRLTRCRSDSDLSNHDLDECWPSAPLTIERLPEPAVIRPRPVEEKVANQGDSPCEFARADAANQQPAQLAATIDPHVNGDLPSVGSAGHAGGTCSPCSFFRRERCRDGQACGHCHFAHAAEKHPRKKTRDRQKLFKAREEAERLAAATGPPGVFYQGAAEPVFAPMPQQSQMTGGYQYANP